MAGARVWGAEGDSAIRIERSVELSMGYTRGIVSEGTEQQLLGVAEAETMPEDSKNPRIFEARRGGSTWQCESTRISGGGD